jgi:hypothetical protein
MRVAIARKSSIADAYLAIVPHTSHYVTMERAALVNRLILEFLQGAPASTMMPIRGGLTQAQNL